MIKGNKSDVANIVFEISARKEYKFFCLILFPALINNSVTKYPILMGFASTYVAFVTC